MAKMLPRCSHVARCITRKRGIYFYRRRVPNQWHREIALSLRTKDLREAEYRAAKLDHSFESLIRQTMDIAELQTILKGYLDDLLAGDLEQRLAAKPSRPVYSPHYFQDQHLDPVEIDLETIEDLLGSARERLAARDLASVSATVDELLTGRNDISGDIRKKLALAVIGMQVRALEQMRERVLGRDDGFALSVSTAQVMRPSESSKAP